MSVIDKGAEIDFVLLALNEAKVEVRIQYKDVTQGIFRDIARNEFVFRIQPSEAIYMKINAKTPGFGTRAVPIEMDLTYKRRFTDTKIPEAYEALILDALKGDHSNFVRDDELDGAWRVRSGSTNRIQDHVLSFDSDYSPCAFRFSLRFCIGSMAKRARSPSLVRIRMVLAVQRSWTGT